MLRSILSLFACLALAVLAWAQDPDVAKEYNTQFSKGIADLNAGRNDEGIAAFKRCLELLPQNPTCAYNIACGHSKKNELDAAFEYLSKAAEWGFGNTDSTDPQTKKTVSNIDFTGTDVDLENLRKDPRYLPIIEKMKTLRAEREARKKKGEEYAATSAVYIPEALKSAAEMPLLVVLHDAGQTKDQVIAGPWKKVAEELGYALLAPSGKFIVHDDPAKGMAWFDDQQAFMAKPFLFERTVSDGVSAFKKEHKLDKARVFIAGENIGGILATDIAVAGPGLYKGVLNVNGSLPRPLIEKKAADAGKMGLKLRLVLDAVDWKQRVEKPEEFDKLLSDMNQSLTKWGIQGGVSAYTPDAKDPDQWHKLVIEALKSLAQSAEPVEAGAPK